MNDIKILGRLTANPELGTSASGIVYCRFTVAVPRRNDKNEADFIRCMAFGKLAEAITQHCHKGRQVLCGGRLQVSMSEKGGQKRYHHTVVINSTNFLHDPNRNDATRCSMAA